MKRIILLSLVTLVLLGALFLVIDSHQKTQAATLYVQWFPLVFDNYNPARHGCELGSPCPGGPPFGDITLP